MIKHITILSIAALMFFCSQASAASFIEGLEDVPVMEGLRQVPNDSIAFGNEESRLVEAILTSRNTSFAKVEKFYKDTLPELGWKCKSESDTAIVFQREGEILEMVRESAKPLKIRITVKSKN